MLAAQRRAAIRGLIETQGAISVADLVLRFGVSDMTIRRDLDALAAEGHLAKVHGGAVAAQETEGRRTEEPGFEAKFLQQEAEKNAIAEAAAALAEPGMSVGLSAGTTTWTLAQRLRGVPDLTVVTNSPRVADIFHSDAPGEDAGGGQTVILTGGVRTPSDALVGPLAVNSLQTLHLDLLFFGTHGFSARTGFTTPNLLEAETNRALIGTAQRAVALADHSKWGVVGIATYARLSQVHTVVSDTGLPEQARRELEEHVDQVILARLSAGRPAAHQPGTSRSTPRSPQ